MGRCATHAIVGLFIALLGAGVLFAGVIALTEVSKTDGIAIGLLAASAVFAAGAVLLIYAARLIREYAFRGARLTIDSGTVTIEDPRGLLDPVVVPINQLVRCAVEKGDARNPGFMFPIIRSLGWADAYRGGSASSDRGWLIQPGAVRAGTLPMGTSDVNLLLVFDRPQFFQVNSRVEGERKRLKANAWIQAVVLPARDADEIYAHLAARGIAGPLEEADVAHLQPVTHVGSDAAPNITNTMHEMGWAAQQTQLDTLQLPQAAANHAFFTGDDTSPIGLTRAQLHRRIAGAVTRFYLSIILVILGIAGAGVWLVLNATRPAGGIILLILAGLLARVALQRPQPDWGDDSVSVAVVEHPRLHAEMSGVAQVLGVPTPSYLDVNFELHGGSRSPFAGSSSSVGEATLGLPILGLLTPQETGALLAHELAQASYEAEHSESVRAGVQRAWVMSVAFSDTGIGHATRIVTRSLMRNLGKLSRELEFLADKTAAEVAGPDALSAALRKTAIAEHHLPTFWEQWVVPALDQGMHPPIVAGFRDYLRQATNGLDLALEGDRWARQSVSGDHYNLQPQLDHRITAIEASFPAQRGAGIEFATNQLLADDGYGAERALLGLLAGWDRSEALRRVEWSEVFAPQNAAVGATAS